MVRFSIWAILTVRLILLPYLSICTDMALTEPSDFESKTNKVYYEQFISLLRNDMPMSKKKRRI